MEGQNNNNNINNNGNNGYNLNNEPSYTQNSYPTQNMYNQNMNNMPNNNYYYDPNRQYNRPSTFKKFMSAILIFTVGAGIGFGTKSLMTPNNGYNANNNLQIENKTNNSSSSSDWNKLNNVKKQIYDYYNGQISEDKLLEGAIKGMVNSLGDPYSVFYNKQEFSDMMSQSAGKFIGVGIQVSPKDGHIMIVSPIDGGPAKEAGILSGDIIYKINDKVYTDKDMEQAVKQMRGKEGETVKLTIKRADKEMDFNIVRREIVEKSVKPEMLQDGVGYIKYTQFTEKSDVDFKNALNDLKSKGMKSLILDLRGNGGGYLRECINIASNFIEKDKTVVYTIDKYNRKKEDKSTGGDFNKLPMVVLIDGGSASASEVLSGALRDYDAAKTVGVKSFGKGIVQSVLRQPNGEGLKLTIAAYYSPKGINIHKKGIIPDYEVEYPKELLEKPYDRNVDPQFKKALEVLKTLMK